jgi:hypothetical protein
MTMKELAERVENATADEQRTILGEVWHTLFPRPSELVASPQHWNKRLNRFRKMLDAEAFESAAMTLAPEGWHLTHSGEGRFMTRGRIAVTLETWDVEQAGDGSDIHTTPNRRHGVAQTFPLALCAAALRAIASQEPTQ